MDEIVAEVRGLVAQGVRDAGHVALESMVALLILLRR